MHDIVLRRLQALGLIGPGELADIEPLVGGVSSDIVLVTTRSGRRFCVKQALSRLKVQAVWEAPVGRNAAEVAWMRTVARWLPDCVPAILGEDRDHGLFAMEYLPPATHPVWKAELMLGKTDPDFAAAVGRSLVTIHARSAGEAGLAPLFANDATFEPIRIDPYLRAAALVHPDLAERLNHLADRTLATKLALVHGDVSPKNILHGAHGPVFLDAECACWGDPAFDLAFCLNHLLLKAARRPDLRAEYQADFTAMAAAYRAGIVWEPVAELEMRCATLLPALMLARIDGKSPVEYLDDGQRSRMRRIARTMLLAPGTTLDAVAQHWSGSDA